MAPDPLNLNVLAHEANQALSRGWRVRARLDNGTEISGRVVRIDEDLARKPEAVRTDGRRVSHLVLVLDPGGPVSLERVRKLEPTI